MRPQLAMVPVVSACRFSVVLGMALGLLSACSAGLPSDTVRKLPPEERAIYQMLALELTDFVQKDYKAENGVCVAVYRAFSSDASAPSLSMLRALEADVAGSPTLIPYSPDRCEIGGPLFRAVPATEKISRLLFASDFGGSQDWRRVFVCGGLCVWGHLYRVEIEGREGSVHPMGNWIS